MTGSFRGRVSQCVRTGAAAMVALCAPAFAGGAGGALPTQYGGHEFLTVGAPGNRAMLPVERYYNQNQFPVTEQVGRVDYEFRISKLEVTATQWLPFIRTAYPIWQEWGGSLNDPSWTSTHINTPTFTVPNYRIDQGEENLAVRVTWRSAALYSNWLQAGMPTGPNVDLNQLRTGAYEISTFRRAGAGGLTGPFLDQAERSPGAQFWIPSLDEWTKAAYFDPNRYAPGNPGPYNGGVPGADPPITGDASGYWLYPNMSQDWPGFGGAPGEGLYGGPDTPVGSYPSVVSPWGVLDILGGVEEWTETIRPSSLFGNGDRYFKGVNDSGGINDSFFLHALTNFSGIGIRIASAVPAPATVPAFGALFVMAVGGRRRVTANN